jgi:hypothetical protein
MCSTSFPSEATLTVQQTLCSRSASRIRYTSAGLSSASRISGTLTSRSPSRGRRRYWPGELFASQVVQNLTSICLHMPSIGCDGGWRIGFRLFSPTPVWCLIEQNRTVEQVSVQVLFAYPSCRALANNCYKTHILFCFPTHRSPQSDLAA